VGGSRGSPTNWSGGTSGGVFVRPMRQAPPPESKLSRSGEVPPTVGGQRMGIQGPLGRLMLGTIEKLEQSAQVELLTPAMPESTV